LYLYLQEELERKFSFTYIQSFEVILKNIYDDSGQEMAGTVIYLASRAGGYAHGQEIVIDGGYTAVNPSRT
jgi:NAD(P)-dependent dehydrogenase (short-subunit alcohol dehydrogenase family)